MSSNEQAFTIINQADQDYCLAIRGRKVVLAVVDPNDPYQIWIRKDTAIKDHEGQPAFAVVNKATNEAMKHAYGNGPLILVEYNDNAGSQDPLVLWTLSHYEEQGFRYIRQANYIPYHLTADSHIVQDGRIVDHTSGTHISERWKFVPVSEDQLRVAMKSAQPRVAMKSAQPRRHCCHEFTISCGRKDGYNLTIRDDTVVLAPADSNDQNQKWIKDISYGKHVKDEQNRPSFALVNKGTGMAIKHGMGNGYLVKLTPFNPNYLDASVLWTEIANGPGLVEIRMQSNTSVVFHAFVQVNEPDPNKALLALRSRNGTSDQQWKLEENCLCDASCYNNSGGETGQWDPNNADISFDGSNFVDNTKPGGNQWGPIEANP